MNSKPDCSVCKNNNNMVLHGTEWVCHSTHRRDSSRATPIAPNVIAGIGKDVEEAPKEDVEELHRIQLAAISTRAGQNTRSSEKDTIGRDNPYWTPTYDDVDAAVKREVKHRENFEDLVKSFAAIQIRYNRMCSLMAEHLGLNATYSEDEGLVLLQQILQGSSNPSTSEIGALIDETVKTKTAHELALGYLYYETTRRLSPRKYAELCARNLGGEFFDAMIMELLKEWKLRP